jgi:hypothetical protein
MVLDISRWLDEHPGGSSIIPEQALNVDSSVFFEIYHASRQSYLYLKEFYIGELAEEDLALVPSPSSTINNNSNINNNNNRNYNNNNNSTITTTTTGTCISSNAPTTNTTTTALSVNSATVAVTAGVTAAAAPSVAFLEQLSKVTTWRLKSKDMNMDYRNVVHKSF